MNRLLLDPFQSNIPEIIEDKLMDVQNPDLITCCAFNRRGTLLAVGCNDGRCILWDFDTRGIAKVLTRHIHPVTAISWSKNGRKILTASTDWNIVLWDVISSSVETCLTFDSMVLSAQMHPKLNSICIACSFMTEAPYLIDFEKGQKKLLPSTKIERETTTSSRGKQIAHNVVASFNKAGDKIIFGNTLGMIYVVDFPSLQILDTIKVSSTNGSIRSISFSRDGKKFLVNSNDRIIRLFDSNTLQLCREYHDVVNKVQWRKCCFSSDNEYVVGASSQSAEHKIYLWNREYGGLIKILEGPKEGIMDLMWHPIRSVLITCSSAGCIYIWATNYTENWSAFAPYFKELEENEEYVEREDEFDIIPEEQKEKKKLDNEEENEEIDILKVDKDEFSSESEDDLFHLPIVPDRDT
eukprot:TRINITY_DN2070_c0_g5_i1.p1 TRINITY_DN2070_c0_g5~~TRINITY_DN2070_c0_g5_i1.p1  ORF type:complete len:427 (-),score=64.60 TRINITY_DN2070_c0_g5_i1:13-1242(-)